MPAGGAAALPPASRETMPGAGTTGECLSRSEGVRRAGEEGAHGCGPPQERFARPAVRLVGSCPFSIARSGRPEFRQASEARPQKEPPDLLMI